MTVSVVNTVVLARVGHVDGYWVTVTTVTYPTLDPPEPAVVMVDAPFAVPLPAPP